MLNYGYFEKIKGRIIAYENGKIIIVSDFADIADSETVRRNLSRLAETGIIRRILPGIYEKPNYSQLLNESIAPSPNNIAHAIARTYHWTIAPSGNTALNLLGLSTQVASTWSYISDGPYKKYSIDEIIIIFKHRTNKEITGLSYKTALVIQALKTLEAERIDENVIATIRKHLSTEETVTMLNEAKQATAWIYSIIKKIGEEALK
ncbi:MAG: DUF6088 family protein [Saccharofermentanales bacterium]